MLFLVIGACAWASKLKIGKQSIRSHTFGCKGSHYGLVDKERAISLADGAATCKCYY